MIVLWLCGMLALAAPGRHAVVIGVSEYGADSGYAPLHADRDVARVTAALGLHGFAPRMLRDGDATADAIREVLTADVLPAVRPGDVVALHFSGHGDRVPDDGADESDGLDEVLIPYAADRTTGFLRDDELGRHVRALRRAAGPQGAVFVSIDACFSASVLRGAATRGGLTEGVGEHQRWRELDDGAAGLAPYALVTAARDDQLAFEVHDADGPVGALSAAVSRALAEAAERPTTHAALFQRVRAELAATSPHQDPQLEGHASALLFGQETAVRSSGFEVDQDGGSWSVAAGLLLGLRPGAELLVRPAGDPGAAPSIVRIDRAELLRATFPPLPEERFRAGAAATRARPGGAPRPLVVSTTDRALAVRIDAEPSLQLGDPGHVVATAAAGGLTLTADDGRVLLADGSVDAAVQRLRRAATARYLRALVRADPALGVTLEVVPAAHGPDGCRPVGPPVGRLAPGTPWLASLRHTGTEPAWVAVIGITPDDGVEVLYPPETRPRSARLGPGQHLQDACYLSGDPGLETLKVISTSTWVDVRGALAGTRSEGGDPGVGLQPWASARRGSSYLGPRPAASVATTTLRVTAP